MSSPAQDIADYLTNSVPSLVMDFANQVYLIGDGESFDVGDLAGTDGWGVFVGKEPPLPNTAITVYDTGGSMGNPDGQMYDPTIQVRVRGFDYPTAYAKAAAIRDILILTREFLTADWFYTGAWLISDVSKIGTDDNNREIFTVNFRLMREPYTTA